MYLKNDKIIATLDGLTMRSFRAGGSGEFILDPTAVIGWTDGVAVRRDATPRATYGGDFPEKAKLSSRLITFTGTAVAQNRAQLQQMRDIFMGTLSNGEYSQLSVQTSVDIRYSTVGLEGTPAWVQLADNVASWKIDLYAPDPHIYGIQRTFTLGAANTINKGIKLPLKYPITYNNSRTIQEIVAVNNGNTDMWPSFRVVGDFFSGFTITDNVGHKVTYSGMITVNSPIVVDMGAGTAIQDGIDKSELLTQRDWFSVGPLDSIRPSFIPIQNGSGWCDIIIRDTWI